MFEFFVFHIRPLVKRRRSVGVDHHTNPVFGKVCQEVADHREEVVIFFTADYADHGT